MDNRIRAQEWQRLAEQDLNSAGYLLSMRPVPFTQKRFGILFWPLRQRWWRRDRSRTNRNRSIVLHYNKNNYTQSHHQKNGGFFISSLLSVNFTDLSDDEFHYISKRAALSGDSAKLS